VSGASKPKRCTKAESDRLILMETMSTVRTISKNYSFCLYRKNIGTEVVEVPTAPIAFYGGEKRVFVRGLRYNFQIILWA